MKKFIAFLVVLIVIAVVIIKIQDQSVNKEKMVKVQLLNELQEKKIELEKKAKRKLFIKSIGEQIFLIFEQEASRKKFVFDGEMCFLIKNQEEQKNEVGYENEKKWMICAPFTDIENSHIQVSIEKQRFYAVENDEIVIIGKVSTGAVSGTTPKGLHRIQNQAAYTMSRKYKCPLIHWMAVTKDAMIGLHALSGTAYEARLGSPASHGCIRLSHINAERLFNWVSKVKEGDAQYPQVYIY